ncbi:hypothetical protein [Oceaniglobus indicus]|uniref:hypothetical protein n=1 Tax=Oceaniglobus indicus TaxID=2047749 RepID=UPI000C17C223|nr:hypothetical protein [Oceaniglobus indicus]
METEDFIFVRVTRTYILTRSQAKQAVTVARALNADTKYHSRDDDGTELVVEGNDYLNDDSSPDEVAAMNDLPDPESLLRIECVVSVAERLTPQDAAEITSRWPDNWREQRSVSDH